MEDEARPDGALHAPAIVVNCEDANTPEPETQVALTLQSYITDDVNPVRLAVVPVCPTEKLVQVEEAFNL